MILKINGGIINNFQHMNLSTGVIDGVVENYNNVKDGFSSIGSDISGFVEFMEKIRSEGLFNAIYDKSFFEITKDFFADFFKELGLFILGNGDMFFLAPAIAFMVGTFFIGNNKFTRWVIPLWFAYFLSTFFYKMLLIN